MDYEGEDEGLTLLLGCFVSSRLKVLLITKINTAEACRDIRIKLAKYVYSLTTQFPSYRRRAFRFPCRNLISPCRTMWESVVNQS